MSNRKRLKKAPEKKPQRRITLTQDNKHMVSVWMGYSIESLDEMLDHAKEQGYEAISFPVPPGR